MAVFRYSTRGYGGLISSALGRLEDIVRCKHTDCSYRSLCVRQTPPGCRHLYAPRRALKASKASVSDDFHLTLLYGQPCRALRNGFLYVRGRQLRSWPTYCFSRAEIALAVVSQLSSFDRSASEHMGEAACCDLPRTPTFRVL